MGSKLEPQSFINRQISCTALYSESLPKDVVELSSDLLHELYGKAVNGLGKYIVTHGINQEQSNSKKWTLYRVENGVQHTGAKRVCLLSIHNKMIGGPPSNSRILIQAVTVVNLTHVVLLCPPDDYERVKSIPQSDAMQHFLGAAAHRIVRQGEYDPSLNGIFKLCEPVDQGILSEETKITIIKDQIAAETTEENSTLHHSYDDIDIEIANFFTKPASTDEQLYVSLDVLPLHEPISVHSIIPSPEPKDDPESRAFVRIEQLLNIGCFSGDVVSISLYNRGSF